MSEDSNIEPKKDVNNKRNIVWLAIAAIAVISILAYYGSYEQQSKVTDLQSKVNLLENQTYLDNRYIIALVNKTIQHDQFDQSVGQWANQINDRVVALEKKK